MIALLLERIKQSHISFALNLFYTALIDSFHVG